ncbi:MAG TPA: Rieske (2Fe-2S) protein [Stellaceae bacterium]|nr:Rieske (2Fe-2S) protein [Stellaceae bacterium]
MRPNQESVRLCHLDEIPEPGSLGFRLGSGTETRAIFVVRRDGRVVAYENSCPHTGSPLDWRPDVFLDLEKRHILCATHGALFRIEDGYCLAGPCAGKGLKPVAITIEEGCICFSPTGAASAA